MTDALTGIKHVLGDQVLTNLLLGWCAFELRRTFPYVRALATHFKLTVFPPKRATTEPGT